MLVKLSNHAIVCVVSVFCASNVYATTTAPTTTAPTTTAPTTTAPTTTADDDSDEALSRKANDPTAALAAFQIQNQHSSNYYNSSDYGNSILFRTVTPYTVGGRTNIARLSVNYETNSVTGKEGFGDLSVFNLTTFEQSWGRWFVGPVMLLPTASDDELGNEKWAAGPAAGFVIKTPKYLMGLLNQNLVTFAGNDDRDDVNITVIQPLLSYSLGGGWSVGNSEMTATYDWKESQWTSIPLGGRVSKVVKVGKLPVQFTVSYEHNFQDDFVAPENTFDLSVRLLFPLFH